jgi:hypothetical protein
MVIFTSFGVTKYYTLPYSVVLKAKPSAYPLGVTATVTTLSGIDSSKGVNCVKLILNNE